MANIDIISHTGCFLIVKAKMFNRSSHTLTLDAIDICSCNIARKNRVLRIVLEVPATQWIALEADTWSEKYVCSIFENFIADMGRRPSKEHTLERLDNNSGYAPENCVWATRIDQARNKRNNLNIEMNGRTQCLAAWCEELDLYYDTVHARLYASGWSPEKALMTPTRLGYIPYSSR